MRKKSIVLKVDERGSNDLLRSLLGITTTQMCKGWDENVVFCGVSKGGRQKPQVTSSIFIAFQ